MHPSEFLSSLFLSSFLSFSLSSFKCFEDEMLNALPEFFHHHRKVAIKIFPSNGLSKCLMQVVWWSEKEGGEKEQIPKQSNLYITGALKIYSPSQLITCHISLKQRNWLIARLFYFRNLCVKNICSERLSPLLDLSSWLTFVYLWLKKQLQNEKQLEISSLSTLSFVLLNFLYTFPVGAWILCWMVKAELQFGVRRNPLSVWDE